MDARDVLVVSPTTDGLSVDVHYNKSDANLDAWCGKHGVPDVIIATGFIAKTPAGQVTTLKRNGSDYSATIMGALFRSGKITIWSDVDGVYSADPRVVSDAVCLDHLTYNEAWELSYFGAQVLHPRTTIPAMRFNIPINTRNFFNRDAKGSEISREFKEDASSGSSGVKVREADAKVLSRHCAIDLPMRFLRVESKALMQRKTAASYLQLVMEDAVRALRAVHSRFYEKSLPIGVGLVGPGLIGSTFLSQLKEQSQKLTEEYHVDIRILGIATSKKMVLSDTGIDLDAWKEDLDTKSSHWIMMHFQVICQEFSSKHSDPGLHCIRRTTKKYLNWMKKGVNVITPNKKLNSGDLAQYQALKAYQRSSYTHFFYEGTVGAGLPVIAHITASCWIR
eukprot:jgi/Picre1/30981/NNA_006339.t1